MIVTWRIRDVSERERQRRRASELFRRNRARRPLDCDATRHVKVQSHERQASRQAPMIGSSSLTTRLMSALFRFEHPRSWGELQCRFGRSIELPPAHYDWRAMELRIPLQ